MRSVFEDFSIRVNKLERSDGVMKTPLVPQERRGLGKVVIIQILLTPLKVIA